MPQRKKIYTRKGDDGSTSLGGGQRVSKFSFRVQAYGTVDELNSQIGLAIAYGLCEKNYKHLARIQSELFTIGSELSFLVEDKKKYNLPSIDSSHLKTIEEIIDQLTELTPPLKNFILPGGTTGSAQLHVARTVCRRAEREVIELSEQEEVGEYVIPYLNRLSDLLFIMARYENSENNLPEILWNPKF